MTNFGKTLREKRKEKNWSMRKLSNKANVPLSTISCYENDKRIPNIFIGLDLANALNCSIYELCGLTDISKSKTVDEIADLLTDLMINGEFEIYIDTEIAREIIDIVRGKANE